MFKDKDIVCFFGDSITSNGRWIAEIYQYLRKKYQIKCYNCGNSGASARKAVEYVYSNCLSYNPDYVVTMFGVNDIVQWLFSKKYESYPNRQQVLDTALENHKIKYELLIKSIVESGAKVIMCFPVPYDEISTHDEENVKCQWRLDEAIEFQKKIAEKYGCYTVDFRNLVMPYLEKHKLYDNDRVHPNKLGHHVMAQIFLNEIGEKDDIDIETPFEFEDWNEARFTAEQAYKPIDYVEFCDMFDHWVQNRTSEEKKQIVKERYDKIQDKSSYIPRAYKKYMEEIDIRPRLVGEVVKLTIF